MARQFHTKTVAEISRDYGYHFSSIVGTRMGVYRVTAHLRNRVQLHCEICGQDITMTANCVKNRDLRQCFCDKVQIKGGTLEYTPKSASGLLGIKISDLRRIVKTRLGRFGKAQDEILINILCNPDAILKVVGPRTKDDLCEYLLKVRKGEMPYPENFFWDKQLRTDTLNKVMEYTRNANRKWVSWKIRELKLDPKHNDLCKVTKYGVPLRKAPKNKEGYERFVGQTFGCLEITQVSAKESCGVTYYIFTYKCKRCGHEGTKRASNFLAGNFRFCSSCEATAYLRWKRHRNSAVSASNMYNRLNMLSKREPLEIANAPTVLCDIISNYISQYTLKACNGVLPDEYLIRKEKVMSVITELRTSTEPKHSLAEDVLELLYSIQETYV